MIEYVSDYSGHESEIVALFIEAFSESESAEEGAIIGALAEDLLKSTAADDIYVFAALDAKILVGCIIFSLIKFAADSRTVFILSPVAVKPELQRRGIGQALLKFGLNHLRTAGIDVALTYGDPNYYDKVGFRPINETFALPPFPLSQPHGWLGQPLGEEPFEPLKGRSQCVDALNKPAFW